MLVVLQHNHMTIESLRRAKFVVFLWATVKRVLHLNKFFKLLNLSWRESLVWQKRFYFATKGSTSQDYTRFWLMWKNQLAGQTVASKKFFSLQSASSPKWLVSLQILAATVSFHIWSSIHAISFNWKKDRACAVRTHPYQPAIVQYVT